MINRGEKTINVDGSINAEEALYTNEEVINEIFLLWEKE
jgi:hypothetical protein